MIVKVFKAVLLFLFGCGCLITIESCYYDWLYSDNIVLSNLSDEFEEDGIDYINFFKYSSKLGLSLEWDSIEVVENVEIVERHEEPKIEFFFSHSDSSLSYEYDGGFRKYNRSPKEEIYLENFEEFESKTGMKRSQYDSLILYAKRIEEQSFSIYKDGSVVIDKNIGHDIIPEKQYFIVYRGKRVFLLGNYWYTEHENIFIGQRE